MTPIREYDDRQIGSGSRGWNYRKIQALYFDYVHGRKADHAEWLAHVK